jgi:hypothetical protein
MSSRHTLWVGGTCVSGVLLHVLATATVLSVGGVGDPEVGEARLINPRLFGFSSYLGPVVNLSYSDPAVMRVARVMRMGSLRYVRVESLFSPLLPKLQLSQWGYAKMCAHCVVTTPHQCPHLWGEVGH